MAEKLSKILPSNGSKIITTTIAKIESGERAVKIEEAVAFADLFGLSLDTLAGRARSQDELANVLRGLQLAASKSVLDVAAIHGQIQGWLMELMQFGIDGLQDLDADGTKALEALKVAQAALFDISAFELNKKDQG